MYHTIFCRTCGKELSDEAFMCPNCGTPVSGVHDAKQKPTEPAKTETKASGLSVVAFLLATIAFVTGIIFGAFFFVFVNSALLVYIIGASTILPALTSLSIGVYLLISARNGLTSSAKAFSITAIVLSSVALLFLFIGGCVIVGSY